MARSLAAPVLKRTVTFVVRLPSSLTTYVASAPSSTDVGAVSKEITGATGAALVRMMSAVLTVWQIVVP